MSEKKELICICCPIGCSIEVACDFKENKIESITGNKCKRGREYSETECFHPVRTLTSTVVLDGQLPMVPVKSEKPLPKHLIMDCMKVVNNHRLHHSVKIGDVIIENILNTGINIIVTSNVSKKWG